MQKEIPGILSNFPNFQDAFSRLKPIPGFSRANNHPDKL